MTIRQLIERFIRRTESITKKPRYPPVGSVKMKPDGTCGACGGEIVEVNSSTHRMACFKCGKAVK